MQVANDHIYLAPGNGHLVLEQIGGKARIRIDPAASASGVMPSVDPMFDALALHYGAGACRVILSGMGKDGLLLGRIYFIPTAPIDAEHLMKDGCAFNSQGHCGDGWGRGAHPIRVSLTASN